MERRAVCQMALGRDAVPPYPYQLVAVGGRVGRNWLPSATQGRHLPPEIFQYQLAQEAGLSLS
jgi:hypothetical protein